MLAWFQNIATCQELERGDTRWTGTVTRSHSALLAACSLLTTGARSKCPFQSSSCLSLAGVRMKWMWFCSRPLHLGRGQKDQTEQNRGFERIISQTQGLLLGLDTVCLVTIYLCNCQAQRSLFIKGPTPGSFGMLNTSADYKGLRSVQRMKDCTLFIVLLLLGGWLKS